MAGDVEAIVGMFAGTVFRRDLRPIKGIIRASDAEKSLIVEILGDRGSEVFRQH